VIARRAVEKVAKKPSPVLRTSLHAGWLPAERGVDAVTLRKS
jgi:hypothetical protein